MKKALLFLTLVASALNAQEGVHYQFHASSQTTANTKYLNDTVVTLVKVANVSNFNAFAQIDIEHETWSYITSPTFSYNTLTGAKLLMKNYNNGMLYQSSPVSVTTDRWQTVNSYTLPAPVMSVMGVTPFGYFAYANNTGTYSHLFSSDGINWSSVSSCSVAPRFSRSKNKLYTTMDNILKSSTDGGASYTTVNASYLITGNLLTPNDDTLFVVTDSLEYSFDGGMNWNKYEFPTTTIAQIAAKNGKELMIIDANGSPKNVYYTNNSGLSWTTYTTIPSSYSNQKLLASSQNFILYPNYKSADGASWLDFMPPSITKPYDVAITGNVVLVGLLNGYFGFSLNKGQTFNFLSNNKVSTVADLMAVKAIDANTFLAADRKGNIYVTTDQGQSWSKKTNSTTNNVPRKFSVSDDKSSIVLSALGFAYVSFDGGNTFTSLNTSGTSGHYQTIRPTSGKIIDVAPLYTAPSYTQTAFEFYEINSSNTYSLINTYSVTTAQDIIDIKMANENVGYLMTRDPSTNETIVYKTTNGWATTSTVSAIPTPSTGIRAYDGRYGNINTFGTDTVIISGSGNPINNQTNFYHISTNGGVTWNIVYPDLTYPTPLLGSSIYKMDFFNPNEHITLISGPISGSSAQSSGVYLHTNQTAGSAVGIREYSQALKTNQLLVYPNPANDKLYLNIQNASYKNIQVNIYNVYGQLVKQTQLNSVNEPIELNEMNSGIYVIQVSIDGKTLNSKFIKH